MKFSSTAFAFFASGISAVSGMKIRGDAKTANTLMSKARRLEENGGNYNYGQNGYGGTYGDMDENSMYFLRDYSIHLLTCLQGEQVVNYEDGETEGSSIIFRLCPTSSCDASNAAGCNEGYGDYVVGINTFLEAYKGYNEEMEEQYQNQNYNGNYGNDSNGNSMYTSMVAYNQYGEEFNAEEYMECGEYNAENNQNDDQQQQQQFFIGPTCSDDGSSIILGMYYEETCTYTADIDFSQIAYGWNEGLPFTEGNLVSMECVSCVNYDWETNELCSETYVASSKRCEENMESYSYMGQATGGCEYISGFVSSNSYTEAVTDTVAGVSTKFMDTLNSTEAGLFIAGMVILSIGFLAGMFITCFCCMRKKKDGDQDLKENGTVDSYNQMQD